MPFNLSDPAFVAMAAHPSGPESITNAQKLSLPVNTAVGTEVYVSDGFVVSGFGDARDGFYFPYGVDVDFGGTHWTKQPISNTDADNFFRYNPNIGDIGAYEFGSVGTNYTATAESASGGGPWVANWSSFSPPLTLTNPALQQLAAPSSAITGFFLPGVGVFTKRGTSSGKDYYVLVGDIEDSGGAGHNNNEAYWNGTNWLIIVDSSILGQSTDDVARPDLITTWVIDPLTITGLSTNTLTAGIKIGSTTYQVNGALNGKWKYSDVLAVATDVTWDTTQWTDGTNTDSATPAGLSFGGETAVADPVAAEGNWTNL